MQRRRDGYTRVPSNGDDGVGDTSRQQRILQDQAARERRIGQISSKLHALLWVGLSVAVVMYTDIIHVSLHDKRVRTFFLAIGIACNIAALIIFLYLVCWLSYIKRIDKWDVHSPKAIPFATGCGVLSIIAYIIALWPIYGFLTPFLIGILTFGTIFSVILIPLP